jgi:hypothetical protein
MTGKNKITGLGMFVLRCLFWLTALVMLLPPSDDGDPAPRVNLLHAALATRVLVEDMSGLCERNPEACATSREALALLGRKLETGAGIVASGIAARRSSDATDDSNHGTLTQADLQLGWSVLTAQP